MPNIFSRIGRSFLPPPVDPRVFMSDANGLTGQGDLTDQDPAQQQDPLGDALPNRVTIPQSAFPQNGGDHRFPPSAFPESGNQQPQQSPQLPPVDPYIQQLRQTATEPAPNPHVPLWRQIVGGVAGMTAAAPFAPLIKYGPKGLQQMRDYQQRQGQLPEQVRIEQLASQDRDRLERDKDRDEAQKLREWQEHQAADVNQRNELDRFAGRGGEMLQPQAMDLSLTPLAEPQSQADTNPDWQGPRLPPQVSLSSGNGMASLPQRITVPPIAQVPQGYVQESSAPYDPRGTQRVAPTPATRKRMELQAAQDVAQAGWLPTPKDLIAKGYPNRLPPADIVRGLADVNKPPTDETADWKNYQLSKKEGYAGSFEDWQNADANRRKPQVNVNSQTAALDRELTHFAKPHEKAVADASAQLEKINDASAMVMGSAEAQALAIPKVLTALVSGQGTGVRITQPELNAIAKARGIVGDFQGFLNSITGKGKLTATQQQQLVGVLNDAKTRILIKQRIANDTLNGINAAKSRDEMADLDKKARESIAELEKGDTTPAGTKNYTQSDVDAAVTATPGATAAQIESAFKAKGWTKK